MITSTAIGPCADLLLIPRFDAVGTSITLIVAATVPSIRRGAVLFRDLAAAGPYRAALQRA